MLVGGIQRSVHSKVCPYAAAHDGLAIDLLADDNGGVGVKEGDYDPAEGFKRCPGVNRGIFVDGLADLNEV